MDSFSIKDDDSSIETLFQKNSSIDTNNGTDKVTTHSYGAVYNVLFSSKKKDTMNILEIGISGGFSLLCYAEYFTNATIYGIDIVDSIKADVKKNPRIKIFIQDANDNSLIQTLPRFDIIIEDASHQPQDQIAHFLQYSTRVNAGGVYIIEDVNSCNLELLINTLTPHATSNDFSLEVYDGRTKTNRGDDILLIFQKKT